MGDLHMVFVTPRILVVGLAIVSDDDDDESLVADLADGWQRAPVSS